MTEWPDGICLSMWDGCCCDLPTGHEGLHWCPAEGCHDTWTDEQAEKFMREIREGK